MAQTPTSMPQHSPPFNNPSRDSFYSSSSPSARPTPPSVMYGWTFHQSHDQATVLFLVPRSVTSKDLDVQIGTNYIIAAVRSQPAIIKARLYGCVNIETSTWRIGDRERPRSKRKSRSLRRQMHLASSIGNGSSTASSCLNPQNLSSHHADVSYKQTPVLALEQSSPSNQLKIPCPYQQASPTSYSPPRSHSSLAASTSSLHSASSYEVLSAGSSAQNPLSNQYAHDTGGSKTASWSSASSDVGSSESLAAMAQSSILSEPESVSTRHSDPWSSSDRHSRDTFNVELTQSPSTMDDETSSNMLSSVASLDSPPFDLGAHHSHFGRTVSPNENDTHSSQGASSPSRPPTDASSLTESEELEANQESRPPAVRLVTIHLEKLDSGIWPLLVVGPAPLQLDSLPPQLRNGLSLHHLDSSRAGMTQSLIADYTRRSSLERSERRRRQIAERQLALALREALSTYTGSESSIGNQPSGIRAYLGNLSLYHPTFRDDQTSDGEIGTSTSTLSINTVCSDESATVLGNQSYSSLAGSTAVKPHGAEKPELATYIHDDDSEEDEIERLRELEIEAKFNMDPTTLSLIGLQVAHKPSQHPSSGLAQETPSLSSLAPSSGIPEAFEYFARAWRTGDIGLATERLVHDFLPLEREWPSLDVQSTAESVPSSAEMAHQSSTDTFRPASQSEAKSLPHPTHRWLHVKTSQAYFAQRQRLVASLGGPKALARLYVSYAKLQLPSSAENRSPLAFPYGQLNSPFVSGVGMKRSSFLARASSMNLRSSSSRASSVTSSSPFPQHDVSSRGRKPQNVSGTSNKGFCSRGPSPTLSPQVDVGSCLNDKMEDDFFIPNPHTSEKQPGPIHFFEEAIRLDACVSGQISQIEWNEAMEIEEMEAEANRRERECIQQAEEMGNLAGDSNFGQLTFESDGESIAARRERRRKRPKSARCKGSMTGSFSSSSSSSSSSFQVVGERTIGWLLGFGSTDPTRRHSEYDSIIGDKSKSETKQRKKDRQHRRREHGKKSRPTHKATNSRPGNRQGGVINFVSGAAILSLALAGSVAAIGWWRRASNALPSST